MINVGLLTLIISGFLYYKDIDWSGTKRLYYVHTLNMKLKCKLNDLILVFSLNSSKNVSCKILA